MDEPAPDVTPDHAEVVAPSVDEAPERAGPTAVVLNAALLAVVGAVLLLVGVLHSNRDVVPVPWSINVARWLSVAAVVLSTLLVVARHLATERPAGTARRKVAVTVTLATAVCSFVLAGMGLAGVLRQLSRHFVGPTPVPFLGGGLALGIAMALLVVSRPRRVHRPASRALALCWPIAVIALCATLVATTTASGWFVSRTIAGRTVAAPVPTSLDGGMWSTSVPGSVRQLIAAGAGVVLSDDHEVEALDGRTGKVRWTYGRSGTSAINLAASPDLRFVAFEMDRVEHDKDVATQTVVLDAFTGRTRLTYAEPRDPHDLPEPFLTNSTLIVGTGLGFDEPTHVFRAISLASGRTAWTYTDPTNCESSNNPAYSAVPAGLLIAHACGGLGVTLFDAATGDRKWTVPWRFSTSLSLTPDGRYLAGDTAPLPKSTSEQQALANVDKDSKNPNRYSLIDTRTGRAVLHGKGIDIDPGGPIEQMTGTQRIIRDPTTLAALTLTRRQQGYLNDPTTSYKSTRIGGDWYVRLDDSTRLHDTATQISLAAGPYTGATRRITVGLGGPYRSQLGSLGGIVPAPGAIVVYFGAPTVTGHPARVVGLTHSAPRQ